MNTDDGPLDDLAALRRAIALSAEAARTPGCEPFGAVVVRDGRVLGEGFNHAGAHWDPTAHGEVEAIRDACRRGRTLSLAGATMVTSCEPCALCVAAMQIAGIGRLVYAASLAQSEAALAAVPAAARPAVDVDALRREAGAPLAARRMSAVQQLADEALAVLRSWAAAQASAGAAPR